MSAPEDSEDRAVVLSDPPIAVGDIDEPWPSMSDVPPEGSVLDSRFRLVGPLGTGSMGRVLRAIDSQTGDEVALKLLHRERARDPEALERFRREAAILESIGHPAIVRVISMGQADGTPWLAMELLHGETLEDRLKRGPLGMKEIVPILNTLCDGLAAAHVAGVVHRDLKPSNVLLTSSGQLPCKLLDFGLSRIKSSKTLTQKGTVIGTPRYMAPEQIRSSLDADARSDTFSVGVILYEMLTGVSPYPAEDLGQLLGCVFEQRTVPLDTRRPDLPPAVGAVIVRAMARDPNERFQTAGAIAEAYANAIGVNSGRSMLPSSPELSATPAHDEGASPLLDPFEPTDAEAGDPAEVLLPQPAIPVAPTVNEPTPRRARMGLRFVIALVVVVILASVIAIALRAWIHGTVHLPGMSTIH
jgi:serine/threonine-protein kinase